MDIFIDFITHTTNLTMNHGNHRKKKLMAIAPSNQ
jgi:hypothetical protein